MSFSSLFPVFSSSSVFPLCFFDQSVVPAGFIDFIVEPTFSGLIDTAEKVIGPLIEEERQAKESGNRRTRFCYYNLSQKNGSKQKSILPFYSISIYLKLIHSHCAPLSIFLTLLFVCFSLTGSGTVTVESVQRHSSSRQRSSDDGQMDFSLTAIDLPALRLHLSGVITSNKDRWKELSVHGTYTNKAMHYIAQISF